MSWYRRFGKRGLDVGLAAVGLVVAAPLIVLVSVMVLVMLGRPVFFVQVRAGREGRPFRLVKFRTMSPAHPGAESDAERLGRFGAALRATSLDELPQVWNILRGDMSLVGPRPLYLEYIPRYSREQARRLEVRPGLTGWAQVNGRNALDWPTRFRYDAWYVDHLSAGLDIRILALTVWKVLFRRGVSQPGHVTMEPFLGEPLLAGPPRHGESVPTTPDDAAKREQP